MLGGHGGNIYEMARRHGCSQEQIIDMSSNINPLGPPPGLLDHLKANLLQLTRLPEAISAETSWKCLAKERILIRNCSNFAGLSDQFIRISLKRREANRMLAEKLVNLVRSPVNSCQPSEKKRTISV
jgi:histidinol-phosphate/aromatic aminotransferase/cobyric acid decarboxylase-like protein